eukprot:172223_1
MKIWIRWSYLLSSSNVRCRLHRGGIPLMKTRQAAHGHLLRIHTAPNILQLSITEYLLRKYTLKYRSQYSPTFDHRISSSEIHSEIRFPIVGRGVETRKPPDIGPKLTPAHCSVEPAGPSNVSKKTCVLHVDEEQRLSPVTTETRILAVSAETRPSSSTVDPRASLTRLPRELLLLTFGFADVADLCALSCSAKRLKSVADDWFLWSCAYVRRWPVYQLQTADNWKRMYKER